MQGEENSEDENALLLLFLCLTFQKNHERLECISQGLSGRRRQKTKQKKNPKKQKSTTLTVVVKLPCLRQA